MPGQILSWVVVGFVVIIGIGLIGQAVAPPEPEDEVAVVVEEEPETTASEKTSTTAAPTTATETTTPVDTATRAETEARKILDDRIGVDDAFAMVIDDEVGRELDVTYSRGTAWDEVDFFHTTVRDYATVMPAFLSNGYFDDIPQFCLTQQTEFVDALGNADLENGSIICMDRATADRADFENVSPDPFYALGSQQAETWPSSGFMFWLSPVILRGIDFS